MYLNIHARVRIGEFEFRHVNEVEIRSGIKTLTGMARVTIPRRFMIDGKLVTDLRQVLPDDQDIPVQIWLGYNGNLELEFTGYVDHYDPRQSLTIYCQDEMYKLKRGTVRKAFQAAKLKDLVNEITGAAYALEIPDISLGDVFFKDMSAAVVLQKLQEQSSIYTYFKPGSTTLVSGFPYDQTYDTHILHLQKNVKSHVRLTYEKRDPNQYEIKAISNLGNGQKMTGVIREGKWITDPAKVEATPGLNVRTLNFGPMSAADLRKFAEAELKRFNYTGWRGQLTTFGQPRVKPGDIVDIQDAAYGRTGRNLVDEVITRVRPVMFERELTLGPQV